MKRILTARRVAVIGATAALLAAQTTAISAETLNYVSGLIAADGTALVPSPAYTVQHPKTGKYELTFTKPFKPYPNCIAVPFASGARLTGLFVHRPKNPVSCIFYFEDIKTSKHEDTYFSFIALPLSH